jgi:hypothetical protein
LSSSSERKIDPDFSPCFRSDLGFHFFIEQTALRRQASSRW